MKKILARAGILGAIFVAAVVIFSILTSRQNADMTVDMGNASLPQIIFETEGYELNPLAGYTSEMDLTAMRDTLTPLDKDGNLTVRIKKSQKKIKDFSYTVYSLNVQKTLAEGKAVIKDGAAILSLGAAMGEEKEAVLKIELQPEDGQEIRYYTRITLAKEYHIRECLDFIEQFHTDAITKNPNNSIASLLEPNAAADNGTLQHVTLHCDYNQVLWGELKPEVVGDVQWNIKEGTTTYTSVQLKYKVRTTAADGAEALYYVKEYFRVRYYREKFYLLDYDRTMEQLLDENSKMFSPDGIDLGIVPEDISYVTNKDGTVISFVQARELWNYDQDEGKLSRVFSFLSDENDDIRNEFDQHQIKIISVDEDGSTTFAVYGYMNRGQHEGKVGAAIYYYNLKKNFVEEKAFIPSRQSFAIAEDELGKLIYYNHEKEHLYVMLDGSFYRIYLKDEGKEVIVGGLSENQYAASSDGHLIAFQTGGEYEQASEIKVMNLQTEKEYTVEAGGATVKPLGFIYDDFVYGVSRAEDAGKTVSGTSVVPMYRLEIRSTDNQVLKTYENEGVYILDVFIEDNLLTMNRVARNGEIYTAVASDYITGNEELEVSNIQLEAYQSETEQRKMMFSFDSKIEDISPKILKPKQVLFENPVTVTLDAGVTEGNYYVYGLGQLLGVYDRAGYAVVKANAISGVVVDSSQVCVWEKGNRDLSYEIEGFQSTVVQEGESTLAASVRAITEYEGNPIDVMKEMANGRSAIQILTNYTKGRGMDLTGCTVEQVLYIIGKGTPVIALTDHMNAVILTGYTSDTVTYMNPADGSVHTVSTEEVAAMSAGSGNTFIGYVKD